jgi:hypothetical protein
MNLAPRELPGDEYHWGREVALAWDCLCNALLRGWHHETLSSRSWRAWALDRVFGRISKPIIDLLFAWQHHPEGHCHAHHKAEVERADLIVKARSTK